MSLNGNLEDLPLLDILQIVSFSKKTGYLSIRTAAGEGAIVFEDGFVVASFTWDSPPPDPRARALPADKRALVLRARIEMALQQLIRLREGQFSFSLTDETPKTVGARDISEETLARGLNAQELLLDLARGMDEDRRDSTAALEASFADPAEAAASPGEPAEAAAAPGPPTAPAGEPPAAEVAEEPPVVEESLAPPAPAAPAAAAPAAAAATILLVDDEEEVRRVLAEHFTRAGFPVVEAEDPDSAVKAAHRLGKEGVRFLLVTDLGMPTSGGTSFQGGFEVVKRLWKMGLRPAVLLMAETLSATLQSRARQMGIAHFVFKPGLSKLDPEQFEADLRAFAEKILSDMLPRMTARAAKGQGAAKGAGRAAGGRAPSPDEVTREFTALQKRLEELRRPQDASQISTLVMRVAREFFERGILFLVKNDEARGLGGFGMAPGDEKVGLAAREVVIPLAEASVFSQTAIGRRPYVGPIPDEDWSDGLYARIGRFQAERMALLPLLTNRETIALLYGDNPGTGRAIGRLDGLEVFINQAGIALENAFLQRKVQAMRTADSG